MCMCACVAVLINFADGSAGNKRNTSDNLSYTKVLSVASIGTVTGVGGRPEKKKKILLVFVGCLGLKWTRLGLLP